MDAYIIGGYRTAVGKAPRGLFKFMRADELGAKVIQHLLKDFPQLDQFSFLDLMIPHCWISLFSP